MVYNGIRITNPDYKGNDWKTLFDLLAQPQFNFKHFDFYDGNLNGAGMALNKLLKNKINEIETVNLSQTTLVAPALHSTILLLKDASNLHDVSLSNSAVDPSALAGLVKSRSSSLSRLILSRLNFVSMQPPSPGDAGDTKLVKFFSALSQTQNLETLFFPFNQMSETEADSFIKSLDQLKDSLKTLSIIRTGLTLDARSQVIKKLEQSSKLESLSIDVESAEEWKDVVKPSILQMKNLKTLYIAVPKRSGLKVADFSVDGLPSSLKIAVFAP